MRTASQLSIPQMPNFHVFHNCPKSYVDVTFSDWNSLWKVGAFATRFIAILCKLRKMQHLYILDILCRILGLLCMQSTKIRPRMGENETSILSFTFYARNYGRMSPHPNVCNKQNKCGFSLNIMFLTKEQYEELCWLIQKLYKKLM